MQCPVCKKRTVSAVELLPDLPGFACSECTGVWIARADYVAWRAKHPGALPAATATTPVAIADAPAGKLCPQCGHILLPYRVGHGLPFALDFCGACGGAWFDRHKWDAIKSRQLHGNLHDIVSANWQAAVRRADLQESVEQTYQRLFGASYPRARETRDWLRTQPQRNLILAYLSDAQASAK